MAPIFTGNKFGFGQGPVGDPPDPITATGGDATSEPGDGYKYHYWTTSPAPTNFVVSAGNAPVEWIVIGGGGGGGVDRFNPVRYGGGGGAGGLRTNFPGIETKDGTSIVEAATGKVAPGTYPVAIGEGGAGGQNSDNSVAGSNGSTTTLGLPSDYGGPIVCQGGGGGGGHNSPSQGPLPQAAQPGGSGGGGYASPTSPLSPTEYGLGNYVAGGDTPVPTQGHPGGTSNGSPQWQGGGGGGAGQTGFAGNEPNPESPLYDPTFGAKGEGGQGVPFGPAGIPPSYGTPGPAPGRWFGGGGGASPLQSVGGFGGGGGHPGSDPAPGVDATANTGGGGGAGKEAGAGNGADGIVIVRYSLT